MLWHNWGNHRSSPRTDSSLPTPRPAEPGAKGVPIPVVARASSPALDVPSLVLFSESLLCVSLCSRLRAPSRPSRRFPGLSSPSPSPGGLSGPSGSAPSFLRRLHSPACEQRVRVPLAGVRQGRPGVCARATRICV